MTVNILTIYAYYITYNTYKFSHNKSEFIIVLHHYLEDVPINFSDGF